MRLLLQRSLDGRSYWVEEAYWTENRLHGFHALKRGASSFYGAKFGPDNQIFCLESDFENAWVIETSRGVRHTQRDTLDFAFDRAGKLVSLEAEDAESPYGLSVEGAAPLRLSEPYPTSVQWARGEIWVSSRASLLRGFGPNFQVAGPSPASHLSIGPDAFFYCSKNQLYRCATLDGESELLFQVDDGCLQGARWTPAGIFVSQTEASENALWLVDEVSSQALRVWHGVDEIVEVTAHA